MTGTKLIFRFFRDKLAAHLVRDPDTLGGSYPTLGVDWVRRVEGEAAAAVSRAIEGLATGHYRTGIVIAMSSISINEEDAAGQEFDNVIPVTIMILTRSEGRAVGSGGAQPEEAIAEWLDDLHDEVYAILDPNVYDPNPVFLNYQYRNSQALNGSTEWKGRRLSYLAWRVVDKTPTTTALP